jgi:plasmid stabilization system protein ParE
MNFTVLWTPAAEQELAAIWLAASDRTGVTAAANAIDRLLAKEPEAVGDLRFDTVRTLGIPPLGADYEVLAEDRLVYVLSVWYSDREDS